MANPLYTELPGTSESPSAYPSGAKVYHSLSIPTSTQFNKLRGKHVTLQNPAQESQYKKTAKAKRKAWQQKQLQAKIRGNKSRGILPRSDRKPGKALGWDVAKGLNALWLGYMAELLGIELEGVPWEDEQPQEEQPSTSPEDSWSTGAAGALQAKLSKADFHGAYLIVKRTKNTCMIGLGGIVVQETSRTWSISTPKNAIKVLPKEGTVFELRLPLKSTNTTRKSLVFELSGTQMAHRATDRATRKLKNRIKGDFGPEGLS